MEVEQKDIKELPKKMNDRWKLVEKKFNEFFADQCTICVLAPGRVNLIGEHVDYSGYGVMPIATTLNVIIAASLRNDDVLSICNTDSTFADFKVNVNNISIDCEQHAWYNYILCGIQGLLHDRTGFKLSGMSLAVNGNIPQGCGLSSSSALVCAASLVVVKLHGLKVEKFELAKICAHSERLIGTEGGGMDQAASFLSKEGYATMIEFSPLRCTPVQLPSGCTFVVANSLVEKVKALGCEYNQRVMECRLASFILAKRAGMEWKKFTKLGNVQKAMNNSFSEMIQLVNKHIQEEPYTQLMLCNALEINNSELHQIISANTRHIPSFYVHKRATHVFQEAERVVQFKALCDKMTQDQQQTKVDDRLIQLGELMFASHSSLKNLYECSHEKLDRLVEISRGIAYGARLTGAGWGGCVVVLLPECKVEEYMKMLTREFYSGETNVSNLVFCSSPASGACSYNVTTVDT